MTVAEKAKTERQYFIASIMELVNGERIGTKYKQLSYPFFATKLTGVPDKDIREFFFMLQRAENRGSAGKIFFARTRV